MLISTTCPAHPPQVLNRHQFTLSPSTTYQSGNEEREQRGKKKEEDEEKYLLSRTKEGKHGKMNRETRRVCQRFPAAKITYVSFSQGSRCEHPRGEQLRAARYVSLP